MLHILNQNSALYILEQLCDYQIIQGGYYDQYELVRRIRSKKEALSYYDNGYKNFQQCWTSFKCPDDMYAYWRRVEFETESGYDYVIFYGVNSNDYRKYSGRVGGSSSWYTMYDNEINFEFKADGDTNYYLGFEFLLKCMSPNASSTRPPGLPGLVETWMTNHFN